MPFALKSFCPQLLVINSFFATHNIFAQETLSPSELKKLSIEQLMDISVALVSETPQKFTESAFVVKVITGDDPQDQHTKFSSLYIPRNMYAKIVDRF